MDALSWIYIANATLIILHEMDSAYRREWELFRLPGGIGGFLVIHVPIFLILLYGLIEINKSTFAGFVISLLLCVGGIAGFTIHMFFIKRGNADFKNAASLAILIAAFAVSLVQLFLTIGAMKG